MIFIAIQCGHNSTIGLSIDGKIISVISEERITRKKNFEGFPIESLKYIKSKYLNNDFSKVPFKMASSFSKKMATASLINTPIARARK